MAEFDWKNIDVVILAGGKGSRLYPLTKDIPKAMVKIGEYPVIEHIVRYFLHFGLKRVKILIGHKGEVICHHFESNFRHKNTRIECIPTGEEAGTAERIWRARKQLTSTFLLSYSDVLYNINLDEMMKFHIQKGKVGTMGVVPLRTSYGVLKIDKANVAVDYLEKPIFQYIWMNCGLFIFKKMIFDYWEWIDNDFSLGLIPKLSRISQIAAYKHLSFWSGMDTVRESEILNELWKKNEAEWAVWRK